MPINLTSLSVSCLSIQQVLSCHSYQLNRFLCVIINSKGFFVSRPSADRYIRLNANMTKTQFIIIHYACPLVQLLSLPFIHLKRCITFQFNVFFVLNKNQNMIRCPPSEFTLFIHCSSTVTTISINLQSSFSSYSYLWAWFSDYQSQCCNTNCLTNQKSSKREIAHIGICFKVGEFLSIRWIVKRFKATITEKAGLFNCECIVCGNPPKKKPWREI